MSSASAKGHVEQGGKKSVSVFCAAGASSILAAGHSKLMVRQFLPMLLSLPVFTIGLIIAFCHISGNRSAEIDRLKMLVR